MSFTVVKGFNQIEKKLRQGWIKDMGAQFADGTQASPQDKNACKFCLSGAISSLSCGQRFKNAMIDRLLEAIDVKELAYYSIVSFNDAYNTTKDDVLELVATARKAARSDSARRTRRTLNRVRRTNGKR